MFYATYFHIYVFTLQGVQAGALSGECHQWGGPGETVGGKSQMVRHQGIRQSHVTISIAT